MSRIDIDEGHLEVGEGHLVCHVTLHSKEAAKGLIAAIKEHMKVLPGDEKEEKPKKPKKDDPDPIPGPTPQGGGDGGP